MMKKITRIAALLAATAFLLAGFPACSDDEGDDDPTLDKIEIGIDTDTVKTTYNIGEEFDKTGITVTAKYSDGSTKNVTADATFAATTEDGEPFTTTAEGTFEVTLTATYDGKTATSDCTITVKAGDGDDPDKPGDASLSSIEIAVAATLKTEYTVGEEFDKTGITVTAKYSNDTTKDVTATATIAAKSGDADFSTATAGTYEVTFTATYEGKTATATRTITVKVNGTTYAWNFQATGLKDILSYSPSTNEATVGKDQLDAEGTYESTPAGLTLVLPKGAAFNKVDPTMSASNASSVGASAGAIEPHESADISVKVRGPFTAVMLCGSNSSTAKADRYAYIKVNGEEVAAPGKANTSLALGEALSYTYTGTDEVTVAFGVSANYIRIYDIKITTENGDGDGEGKTAGEIKSKAEFVATDDDTTANNEATLGLVGTKADSDTPAVATAAVKNDKIVITPVSAGKATITVTDGTEGHEATIEVTVSGTGKITIGKITPYVDLASIFTVTDGVLELKADSYAYYLSADNLNDTTGNNAWSTKTAGNETTGKKSIEPFAESTTVLNMSKPDRYITLKVKDVTAFRIYVQKDGKDRTYPVTINGANEQNGSSSNDFDTFTTGTTDEVTIKIAGYNNQSVYPVGVILYKEVSAED
ncbi:MAG: hypothetical protein HDR38_08635 [Treponema sp.]|nr:hypothetical protein [Treponema sp.]